MLKSSFHWNCWELLLILVRPISHPIFSTDSYLSSLACLPAQSLPQTPLVRFLSVRVFSKSSSVPRKKLKTMRITYPAPSPGSQDTGFQGTYPLKKSGAKYPKFYLTPTCNAIAFSCSPSHCPRSWHPGHMHPSITTMSRDWAAQICRWCQRPRISKYDSPVRWIWSGNGSRGSVHWTQSLGHS